MKVQQLHVAITFMCMLLCPLEVCGLRLRVEEEFQPGKKGDVKKGDTKSIAKEATSTKLDINLDTLQKNRIETTEHHVFNVALSAPQATQDEGVLVGRWLRSPNHAKQCKTQEKHFENNHFFWVAAYKGPKALNFVPLKLPDNIQCKHIGEPKPLSLHGETYIYSDGGGCSSGMWKHMTGGWKQTFAKSAYKNYIFKLDYDGNALVVPPTKATLLATEEPINPNNPTQKNFRFFTYGSETFAITMVQGEHKVHKVDLSTGRMTPAHVTKGLQPEKKEHHLYLSAGPLDMEDGTMLVAGHASLGKWGGYRQTFFYRINAKPPFNIIERTPEFSFGFDNHLEYLTGLNDAGKNFLISLGIRDCDTSILNVPKSEILSKLQTVA